MDFDKPPATDDMYGTLEIGKECASWVFSTEMLMRVVYQEKF